MRESCLENRQRDYQLGIGTRPSQEGELEIALRLTARKAGGDAVLAFPVPHVSSKCGLLMEVHTSL